MRSAMRCAACVLQTSHDAAPIAATAAMMRSHDASMPVPPSCSRVDTEPGSLSHAYGEREVLSLPRGRIWRTARGPRARYLLLQRGLRRGQVDAAVGPSAVPPVFAHGARGRVFKVWCSEFEILTRVMAYVAGQPLTPRCLRRPRGMLWRGWVKQSTPRGLPALQCHQLCPRRFYRVKGWWKAAGAPIS